MQLFFVIDDEVSIIISWEMRAMVIKVYVMITCGLLWTRSPHLAISHHTGPTEENIRSEVKPCRPDTLM